MSTVNRMQVCSWVNVQKVPLSFTSIEASGCTSFLYSGGIVRVLKNYNAWFLFIFLLCRSRSCSAAYLAGNSQNIWSISAYAAELILSIINRFKLARSSVLVILSVFFPYCGTCFIMVHCLFIFPNMYFRIQSLSLQSSASVSVYVKIKNTMRVNRMATAFIWGIAATQMKLYGLYLSELVQPCL